MQTQPLTRQKKSITKSGRELHYTHSTPRPAETAFHIKPARGKDESNTRIITLSVGLDALIDTERNGMPPQRVLSNIERIGIPPQRVYQFINIPRSTAANKIKGEKNFVGVEALAFIRIEKLIAMAESIVSNSLHPDSKYVDAGFWLGEWIERPQPALGGIKPSSILDTEAGGQRVLQILAAIESGSYQ